MTEPRTIDAPGAPEPTAPPRRPLTRREAERRRDFMIVGVLTPSLILGLVIGLLVIGSALVPDDYVAPTATATPDVERLATPTVPIPVQPIDTQKLNAGLVEKPTPFAWPDLDEFRVTPDPARPGEQADYVPSIAQIELRRLLQAISVSVLQHTAPDRSQEAATELAKAYPARPAKPRVLDLIAMSGYLPDDSGYGVIVTYGTYRVHLEAVATSAPIRANQRGEVEYQTQHLGDHILRRLQEVTTGARRTGPEAAAVHSRDHIIRSLPFSR